MIYSKKEESNFDKTTKLFESVGDRKTIPVQGSVEFQKKFRGITYGVIKEHGKYIIKMTSKQSGIIPSDFDYINGYENRKSYERNSLQEAIKHTYLILNESKYVVDVPVPSAPEPAPAMAPEAAPEATDTSADSTDMSSADNEQDPDKKMQKLTGQLGAVIRSEIADQKEDLTVGSIKAIIAAAKTLSPQNKAEVMQKAEEVLKPEDQNQEGQPQDQSQQQPEQGQNPAPPAQPNAQQSDGQRPQQESFVLGEIKNMLREEGEVVHKLTQVNEIKEDIDENYGHKYNFKAVAKSAKRLVITPVDPQGGILTIEILEDNRYRVSYENADVHYHKDLSYDNMFEIISNLMAEYFKTSIRRDEEIVSGKKKPEEFLADFKAKYDGAPMVKQVLAKSSNQAVFIRVVSNSNVDAFVLYQANISQENFDFYAVKKSKIQDFIKTNNPRPKSKTSGVEYEYEYAYKDIPTEEQLFQRVDEFLHDISAGLEESIRMTKGQLIEQLNKSFGTNKKKLNEGRMTFENAQAEARKISSENGGAVQHVDKHGDDSYSVSDWMSDDTVWSVENANTGRERTW